MTATNAMGASLAAHDRAAGTLAERWHHWWFAPETPFNLGVCRLLFFGLLFVDQLIAYPYYEWPTLPKSYFDPIWLFHFFHLPILPSSVVLGLEIVWKLALLLACIGLFTRFATVIACAGAIYLFGLEYNYGKTDHLTGILVFTTGILALARCGDAVSIDRLLQRRRRPAPLAPSGEYRWPVRMVWVLMSVLFFAAGAAKAIHGGLAWITSENFSLLLIQRHYMHSVPTLDWGLFIAKHPVLYKAGAAGAIVGELSLCLALFNRKIRMVLPWMLLAMQVGIGLFMRVWFTPYMFCYLFWMPWDKVLGRRRA